MIKFLSLVGLMWLPLQGWASPMVVELFTSKFCPNCPAVEKRMAELTAENPDWLLLQQHVDYWDRGNRRDPYGLAEATQRQYDYSNTLSRRAGEVFTPMPILNGTYVAPPPLWLNWEKALASAQKAPAVQKLSPVITAGGGVQVAVPKGSAEVWLLGTEPMESPNALRVGAIVPMDIKAGQATLAKALLPKTSSWVVLAQKAGTGAVVGVGRAP